MQNIGVIDIGSNSVRLVTYDMSFTPPVPGFNEKILCSLGRDLNTTGRLYPEGKAKALKTIHAFTLLAEALEVDALHALATAAVREAADGPAFIEEIKNTASLDVRVIEGEEEALYAALGILSTIPDATGVVADLGGGSLELARIADGRVHERISLPAGVLRLADAPDLTAALDSILFTLPGSFKNCGTLYVIGGSWRTLFAAFLNVKRGDRALHGGAAPADRLIAFSRELEQMETRDIAAKFKIEGKRADMIHVAGPILRDLITRLNATQIVVSTAGVREGFLHNLKNP